MLFCLLQPPNQSAELVGNHQFLARLNQLSYKGLARQENMKAEQSYIIESRDYM
jgi:hypothetical protein